MAHPHVLARLEDVQQRARALRNEECSLVVFLAHGKTAEESVVYSGRVDELRAIRHAAQKVIQEIEQMFAETGTKLEED